MCGRYVIYGPKSRNREDSQAPEELEFAGQTIALQARYNAAPTQLLPVYRVQRERGPELVALRWGLIPSWAKDAAIGAKLINARAETVAEKPSFRGAFRRGRCLVPMCGFYEWKGAAGRKIPHFIHLMNEPVFAVAGLHESWRSPAGEEIQSFAIITTRANVFMAALHERMPAIVAPERHAAWCDPANNDREELQSFLEPYPADEMHADPVSARVNAVRNDDESLIQRVEGPVSGVVSR